MRFGKVRIPASVVCHRDSVSQYTRAAESYSGDTAGAAMLEQAVLYITRLGLLVNVCSRLTGYVSTKSYYKSSHPRYF